MTFPEYACVISSLPKGLKQVADARVQRAFSEIAVGTAVMRILTGQDRAPGGQTPGAGRVAALIIRSRARQTVNMRRGNRPSPLAAKHTFVQFITGNQQNRRSFHFLLLLPPGGISIP